MKPAQKQPKKPRPPVRVRYDPPTIEEAVFAAQGLSEELPQQIEIAAGLMGVPEDDVRGLVMKGAMQKKMTARQVFVADRGGIERAVVIERKTVRRRAVGAPISLRHTSIGPMR